MLLAAPLAAQQIKFPPALEKLAAKASETANVDLDASTLAAAGKLMSGEKAGEFAAQKLIGGLKGVHVRSFKFEKEGEYSAADVSSIREQLKGPQWACIVSVQKKGGETTDVCLHREGDSTTGLAVLAAEPKELTVVNIVGTISLEALGSLTKQLGIAEQLKKGLVETKKVVPQQKKDE
jgi:hypothetical protein